MEENTLTEQEEKELERDKIYTCEICNEYQGTRQQLAGHKGHCKGPKPLIIEDEIPDVSREREPGTERKERIPFGARPKKLPEVPDNDGYQYRIVNDNWSKDPGRVQRAERGGYERVDEYEPIAVGTNQDGSPIKGVLMRIPKEWYDEDQKAKQKRVDMVDEAIKGGTLEATREDKRYIPQGIKMWSSFNENK